MKIYATPSEHEIRIMSDKGTKFIVAIRNKGTDCYHIAYTAKGVYKVLALAANKQEISHYAVKMLSKRC